MLLETLAPLADELGAVLRLVAFVPGGLVHAGGRAFYVDDVCPWLVHHPQTTFSSLEAEVGVLEIHRQEELVEPTNLLPEVCPHHQRGGRAVVDLAPILVVAAGRVVAPSVVLAGAVAPDDSPRLGEPAIGVQELR